MNRLTAQVLAGKTTACNSLTQRQRQLWSFDLKLAGESEL